MTTFRSSPFSQSSGNTLQKWQRTIWNAGFVILHFTMETRVETWSYITLCNVIFWHWIFCIYEPQYSTKYLHSMCVCISLALSLSLSVCLCVYTVCNWAWECVCFPVSPFTFLFLSMWFYLINISQLSLFLSLLPYYPSLNLCKAPILILDKKLDCGKQHTTGRLGVIAAHNEQMKTRA